MTLTRIGMVLATLFLAAASTVEAQGDGVRELIGFHVWDPNGNSLCPSQSPPFNHWDLREFPNCEVPYEINPNIPGGPDPETVIQAVHNAAEKWSDEKPSHIQLVDMSGLLEDCPVKAVQDGRNCFAWDPAFNMPGVLAVTQVFVDANSGVYSEVDIILNGAVAWQGSPPDCGAGNPFSIEAVMLHHIGHFLGLGHPDVADVPAGCGNDDPTGQTLMTSTYANACNLELHRADWDGINYLYSADLGDLEDPPYPTKIHSTQPSRLLSTVHLTIPNDGPEHLFGLYRNPMVPDSLARYQYEWLGIGTGGIDDHELECEARIEDLDQFDDGALLIGTTTSGRLDPNPTLLVGVRTAADVRGRSHVYDMFNRMYINAWFDWNADGDFLDSGEHAVGLQAGGFAVTAPGTYGFPIPNVPLTAPADVRYRVRLDYREDAGDSDIANIDSTLMQAIGAAQHGEVEDYVGVWSPTNEHRNRPQGPAGPPIPVGSPVYCHMGMAIVSFGGSDMQAGDVCHTLKPIPGGSGSAGTVGGGNSGITFPDAGGECMDSTLSLGIDIDNDGVFEEMLGLTGPVCVIRGAPYVDSEGYRVIDTEMVSMEMSGHSLLAGTLNLRLAPSQPTVGMIRQSDAARDLGTDASWGTPAFSYFEVVFEIESDELGKSEPVGPIEVTAWIGDVPPGQPNGDVPYSEETTAEEPVESGEGDGF